MYTRDSKYIDPKHVWEVDKDDCVIARFRWVMFDFSKK